MDNILSIEELPLAGKRVLMRVDFNVPLTEDRKVRDDTRIVAALPSIRHVISQKGSLILVSHLGRPKGRVVDELSLAPCAQRLSELLGGYPVDLLSNWRGELIGRRCTQLKPGEVIMLENMRFDPAEEHPEQDPRFAQELASYADCYVNDAFGTAHRYHTSTAAVVRFFPKMAAAGFLMKKELAALAPMVSAPQHPFHAIIGGAKISSKIGVLRSLAQHVDALFIGGGMAYTFFKAQGLRVGDSLVEMDALEDAREILNTLRNRQVPCYLPEDHLITNKIANDSDIHIVPTKDGVPEGMRGVDIGPQTVQRYSEGLRSAKMVFWNGPMGIFEYPRFAKGTMDIAQAVAQLTDAFTVVGGGDSLTAIQQANVGPKISHLSTGGGASLEFIENGHLPGTDALIEANRQASRL